MPNEFKVRNGLLVTGSTNINSSGSSIFTVDGTVGRLFSVDDGLSGSLFSVNTVAGLPIIEAFSDNTVRIGQYGQRAFFVSQSNVGIGIETPTNKLYVSASTGGVLRVDGSATSVGLFVSSSGNVGIGNTSSFTKLQVSPNLQYTAISSNEGLSVWNSSLSNANLILGINGVTSNVIQSRDGTSTAWPLSLQPYGGNVGIGTVSPNARLEVSGSTLISGSLVVTGSTTLTGSLRVSQGITASLQGSASFALTASFALNAGGGEGAGFPFAGFAVITGSLATTSGSGIIGTFLTASETLAAGDFINIATGGIRKASSTDITKQAHGFVTASHSANSQVVVFYSGLNTGVTGLTPGARYFLSASGTESTTPPTATSQLSQEVGVAVSSTALLVNLGPAIIT